MTDQTYIYVKKKKRAITYIYENRSGQDRNIDHRNYI
jgi:hypothetical protein